MSGLFVKYWCRVLKRKREKAMKKSLFAWLIVLFLSLSSSFLLSSTPPSMAFLYGLTLASGLLFYAGQWLSLSSLAPHLAYLALLGLAVPFPSCLALLPSLPFLVPLGKLPLIFFGLAFFFHLTHPLSYLYWFLLTLTAHYLHREAVESQERKDKLLAMVDDYEGRIRRLQTAYLESQTRSLVNKRNAVLEERNRIAREIHDSVGHKLTGTILQLAALEATMDDPSSLAGVRKQVEGALDQVRRSVHAMRDQSLSIESQLQKLAENYTFCPVHLDIKIQDQPGPSLHYFILLSASEALQNTAKHSRASRFDLSLKQYNDQYLLLLWDNGKREGEKEKEPGNSGMGLLSMKEGVLSLGGSMKINQENGFHIFIQVPREESPGKEIL